MLMEADRSTLYLLSDDKQELSSKVLQGTEVHEIRLRPGEGIAGWVVESGETVNITDAYVDLRFQPAVDLVSGYRTQSILCMPVHSPTGGIIGVVQVLNKIGGHFTSEDEHLLSALAGQAAVSIENAKLYHSVVAKNVELEGARRELEHKSHDLNLLFQTEAEMNESLSLDELLDRLLRRAMDLVGAKAGSIALRSSTELYFRAAAGAVGEAIKCVRMPRGEGLVGWVTEHKLPAVVNHPAEDPRHRTETANGVGYWPKNILCVPLIAEEETLGAIELLDKAVDFVETDAKLLGLIAGQASKAILLARAKEERNNQERLASIGQMLSGVLHDLRTPMTIVSGYAQLMSQEDSAKERGQYVEQILRQFQLMESMTREVLAFARGDSNILIRKVYLNKFLEDLAPNIEQEFAGKDIALELDSGYRGIAFFDEHKLLRVIHNLARNAMQAMPRGGVFRISTREEGDGVIFEFTDTGTGIPSEMEGRLFALFATAGKKEGTGLGLAMVKKIVDEHQGQIGVRSKPGEGTTFTIRLPKERA